MTPGTIGVIGSALLGSGIAAFADLAQKGSAGAVFQIQTTFATALGIGMPGWLPVLVLMIVGAGLCFVFQPQTRQAGFAIGLSVISVLMTATPVKLAQSPANTPAGPSADIARPFSRFASNEPLGPILLAQASPTPGTVKLAFQVDAAGGSRKPLGDVTIRVRELPSGKIWQWHTDQFKQQATFPVQFSYDVPVAATTSSVEARLESENYKSAVKETAIRPGTAQVQISFSLELNPLPNFIKKLIEPQRF